MHLNLMLLIRYYGETADGTGSLQKCFVHVEQEALKLRSSGTLSSVPAVLCVLCDS